VTCSNAIKVTIYNCHISQARAAAGGPELRGMAARMGVPH
jgi:hypothetical protein